MGSALPAGFDPSEWVDITPSLVPAPTPPDGLEEIVVAILVMAVVMAAFTGLVTSIVSNVSTVLKYEWSYDLWRNRWYSIEDAVANLSTAIGTFVGCVLAILIGWIPFFWVFDPEKLAMPISSWSMGDIATLVLFGIGGYMWTMRIFEINR